MVRNLSRKEKLSKAYEEAKENGEHTKAHYLKMMLLKADELIRPMTEEERQRAEERLRLNGGQ